MSVKQASKRDTKARDEHVLRQVVHTLETDDSPKGHQAVLVELVTHGPFTCLGGLTKVLQAPPAHHVVICNALRDFIRTLVRGRPSFAERIHTALAAPLTFSAIVEPHRVQLSTEGHLHDQAVLQLVLLIDRVGLSQFLPCPAHGCEHVFVKVRRAKFCSKTCQRRDEVRRRRTREREERLRMMAAAARRKRQHVVRKGAE